MRESTTYQRILREGRNEGRNEGRAEGRVLEDQRVLLIVGRQHLPEPDAAHRKLVEAIQNVDQLETLIMRIVDPGVHDWNDLLGVA